MKGFKLYFYNNSGDAILFSSFIIGQNNNTITFNESIEESEHNSFTLSFSFSSELDFNSSSLITKLRIGRKLKLEYSNYDGNSYIDFIIISITPESKGDNIIYNISAQDYFNFKISRNNVGLSFDTLDDQEWNDLEVDGNIYYIGNYLLKRGNLQDISSYTLNNISLYTKPTSFVLDKNNFFDIIENIEFVNRYEDYIVLNLTILPDNNPGTTTPDDQILSHSLNVTLTGGGTGNVSIKIENTTREYIEITFIDYMGEFYTKKYIFYIENAQIKVIELIVDRTKTLTEITESEIKNTLLFSSFPYIKQYYNSPVYSTGSWKIEEDLDNFTLYEKINFSIDSSNTYNALIELANLMGCLLIINYNNRIISFLEKSDDIFNKNYQLSPDLNLQDFGLTYNGENYYSIYWVEGGLDDYEFIVTMVPYIPSGTLRFLRTIVNNAAYDIDVTDIPTNYYSLIWDEGVWKEYISKDEKSTEYIDTMNFILVGNYIPYIDSFILNLDYLLTYGLLTSIQHTALLEYFYNDLRKANINLSYFWNQKNAIENEIFTIETEIDIASDFLSSGDTENFLMYYNDFNNLFYKDYDNTIVEENKILTLAEIISLSDTSFLEMSYPLTLTIDSIDYIINQSAVNIINDITYVLSTDVYATKEIITINTTITGKGSFISEHIKNIYSVNREWYRWFHPNLKPKITVFETSNLPNLNTSKMFTKNDIALVYLSDGSKEYYIVKEYSDLTNSTSFAPTTEVLKNANIKYSNSTVSIFNRYPLFYKYNYYKSSSYIEERYLYYKQLLIDAIQKRDENLEAREKYNTLKNSETEGSATFIEYITLYESANTNYELYKRLAGEWGYDENNDEFLNYKTNYNNISWSASGDTINPIKGFYVVNPILDVAAKRIYCDKVIIIFTNPIGGDTFSWNFGEESGNSIIAIDTSGTYGFPYVDEWTPNSSISGDVYVDLSDEDWNNFYYEGLEIYGKYCFIVDNFFNYKTDYYAEPNYIDYSSNNLYGLYSTAKDTKDTLWFNIKKDYGDILYEGYYKNELETNSISLYNQAVINKEIYKIPEEDYDITYLDASQILGININQTIVGDKINIISNNLGILEEHINEIQITGISKNLRDDMNIKLSVSLNKDITYLEKLLGLTK